MRTALMEKQFWLNIWHKDHTPFHRSQTNPLLVKHWPKLALNASARVFVPLCGKSVDVIYLSEHHKHIIANELSEKAILALFSSIQQKAKYTHINDDFKHAEAKNIEVYIGDFFQLTKTQIGNVDAIYDRAALVALPADIRARYAEKLAELANPGVKVLLISNHYQEGLIDGPPFSVSEADIDTLFNEHFTIKRLAKEQTQLDKNLDLYKRGLRTIYHHVFMLTRK